MNEEKNKEEIMRQKEIERNLQTHNGRKIEYSIMSFFVHVFILCKLQKEMISLIDYLTPKKKDLLSAHASNETFLMKFKSIFLNELSIALKLCNFPPQGCFSSLPFVYVCRYDIAVGKMMTFLLIEFEQE